MDDRISKLERDFLAKPDDQKLALEFYAQLRRSGKKIEPLLGERFGFECHKKWHELRATNERYVRRCKECAEDVYFAANEDEFREHAEAGRCVAILSSKVEDLLDEIPRLSQSLPMADSPCLVLADWSDLAKEALENARADFMARLHERRAKLHNGFARARLGRVKIPTPKAAELPAFARELFEQFKETLDKAASQSEEHLMRLFQNEIRRVSEERRKDSWRSRKGQADG